jgi:hypothetical protein
VLFCSLNISRKKLNQLKTKNAITFIEKRQVKHLQNHEESKNQEIDQSKLLIQTTKEQVHHLEGTKGKPQENTKITKMVSEKENAKI